MEINTSGVALTEAVIALASFAAMRHCAGSVSRSPASGDEPRKLTDEEISLAGTRMFIVAEIGLHTLAGCYLLSQLSHLLK